MGENDVRESLGYIYAWMYSCIFCSWNKLCFSLLDAAGLIIHLLLILEGWAVICDVKLTDRLLFYWLEKKKKKLLSKWSRAVCWHEGARTILVSRCLNYWLQMHWKKKSSISMSRKRQKNLSLTKDVGPCVRTSYKSAYVSGLIMNQKQHGSQVTVLTPTISDTAALSVITQSNPILMCSRTWHHLRHLWYESIYSKPNL